MDQQKIGQFLRECRKEKGITQEQLAEMLGVTNRSVSRWENGSNLPDLDILIEMADYYDVELRELLDGERKSEKMNKEVEETILKVADYSNQEKERLTRRMCILFVIGLISFMVFIVMDYTGLADNGIPLTEFLAGLTLGLPLGIMAVGILYTSGGLVKIKAFKRKLLNIK